MSFILDALRKSEHERQRQEGPAIADLRAAPQQRTLPLWGLAIGALLAVNLVVVLFFLIRNESRRPPPAEPAVTPAATPAPVTAPASAAAAKASGGPVELTPVTPDAALPPPTAPQPWQPDRMEPSVSAAAVDPQLRPSLPKPSVSESTEEWGLPLASEVKLPNGEALPQMRLDIHVYAQRLADRFVFVNMRKYREGEQTAEGMQVYRITAEGVILEYRGTRFLLPRQ